MRQRIDHAGSRHRPHGRTRLQFADTAADKKHAGTFHFLLMMARPMLSRERRRLMDWNKKRKTGECMRRLHCGPRGKQTAAAPTHETANQENTTHATKLQLIKEQKSLIKTLMHGGITAGVQRIHTCWRLTSCQYFSRGFGTSKRGKRTTNPEIRLAKISPAISLLCFIDAADIVQERKAASSEKRTLLLLFVKHPQRN